MADIRPFKAYRPNEDVVSRVAALPYDVYNRQEAVEVVKKEPMSFLAIDRAETQFPQDHDMYADDVYQKAHDMLWDKIADGTFVHDDNDCYYIYEQNMQGRVQTGIVACSSIDDYQNNIIKKHENTLAAKEADRIHHVDTCDAQTGPIFLCYRNNRVITDTVNKVKNESEPVYGFISVDKVCTKVWIIDEKEDIKAIQAAFACMKAIYIADGHHRCASAVKVGLKRRSEDPNPTGHKEYDYFLSVLFPDDQLMIMDYNRVVKDLNGLTTEEFMNKLSAKYDVEKVDGQFKPAEKYQIGMYMDDTWYKLTAHEDIRVQDAVDGLDVAILQNEILEPVLGISDPKNDKRIDFVGGIRGLSELEKRCHEDMKVAFAMHPTGIHELFDVADAGRLMPPKSTWFEPKLLSGLFIHSIK